MKSKKKVITGKVEGYRNDSSTIWDSYHLDRGNRNEKRFIADDLKLFEGREVRITIEVLSEERESS